MKALVIHSFGEKPLQTVGSVSRVCTTQIEMVPDLGECVLTCGKDNVSYKVTILARVGKDLVTARVVSETHHLVGS